MKAPRLSARLIMLAALIGTMALTITLVVIHNQPPDSPPGAENTTRPSTAPKETLPPVGPAGPAKGQRRLELIPGVGVKLHIPQRAYVSQWDPELKKYASPQLVPTNILKFNQTDKDSRTNGRATIYLTDRSKTIMDILIFSNSRVEDNRLTRMQSVTSKDGVELAWESQNSTGWTVDRHDRRLSENAFGYYHDPTRLSKGERYTIDLTEWNKIKVKGRTTLSEGGTTYIAYVTPINYALLNTSINDLKPSQYSGTRTAVIGKSLTTQQPQEVARFVEWNSFIGPEYVDGDLCKFISDAKYFGGDNRNFAERPASEAFGARGTPRSRISTRVGSSWNTQDPSIDLNATKYNHWLFKAVGTSHSYDANKKLIRVANAGVSDIHLVESSSDGDSALRRVKVDAPNPLCRAFGLVDAPAISYTYSVKAKQDGSVGITATFDQAPDTEILWEKSSDTTDPNTFTGGCLYRFRNRGFEYLAPPWNSRSIDISFPGEDEFPTCAVN